MSKIKGDIEIGRRAYAEAIRIFCSPKKAIERMGIAKQSLYEWKNGAVPGGLALARLHYAGADVLYILTGKKSKAG